MLAQDWLSGVNRVKSKYDAWLVQRLRLPEKFDPRSTPSMLSNIAERIVFTDDVPSLLYEMHRNKQITYAGMFSSARLPFDCFWIEYKSMVGMRADRHLKCIQYGALVQRYQDKVRMVVVGGFWFKDMKHPLCAVTHALEFDEWPIKIFPSEKRPGEKSIAFKIIWSIEEIHYETADEVVSLEMNDEHTTIGNIMTELVFGIFLVTQPKVYTEEAVQWDERKQKARARSGQQPLLEYRRINLRICKDMKRYTHANGSTQRPSLVDAGDTESLEAIRHRRYHKVMGHFRHYMNAIPPRTIWIEQFYRGDPSLGVTFTERDVTK